MRVYIAADSYMQAQVRQLRDELVALGVEVTSRWIDAKLEAFNPTSEVDLQRAAENNFSDIERAVFLVAYNPKSRHMSGTGGRHVEMGYALARYKPVLYVGESLENVFHRAVGVYWIHDLAQNTAPLARVIAAKLNSIWDARTQKVSDR